MQENGEMETNGIFNNEENDNSTRHSLVCWSRFYLVIAKISARNEKKVQIPRGIRIESAFASVNGWMPATMFIRAFRMTCLSFWKLPSLVFSDLSRDEEMGRYSGRFCIQPDVRLGITLRLLSGASYIDVCMMFRVGTTCAALYERLRLPGLPATFHELHCISTEFKISRDTPSPLSGCVTALDGIFVRIKKPRRNEMPAVFCNRKDYYAVLVQALVDAKYRFRCYSCLYVGSTHDRTAHLVSSLGRYLAQGLLRDEFWIFADEAYICTDHLITPFPFSRATVLGMDFNFFLSSFREHIEQGFGQLVRRWRILRDEIGFDVSTCGKIVGLCMKLHNFCVDECERSFGDCLSNGERQVVDAEKREWYNDVKDALREMSGKQNNGVPFMSRKRAIMVRYIQRCGIRRPTLYGIPYLH